METAPVMRKRPAKLRKESLLELIASASALQLDFFSSLFDSISRSLFPSVMFKIALETSGTRGDPLANACSYGNKEMKD